MVVFSVGGFSALIEWSETNLDDCDGWYVPNQLPSSVAARFSIHARSTFFGLRVAKDSAWALRSIANLMIFVITGSKKCAEPDYAYTLTERDWRAPERLRPSVGYERRVKKRQATETFNPVYATWRICRDRSHHRFQTLRAPEMCVGYLACSNCYE